MCGKSWIEIILIMVRKEFKGSGSSREICRILKKIGRKLGFKINNMVFII